MAIPSTAPNGPPRPERQPVSAETKAEHDAAHWASIAEKGAQDDRTSRRRVWMIASVIVGGGIIWLVATTYLGAAS